MQKVLISIMLIAGVAQMHATLDNVAYQIAGAVEEGDYTVDVGKAAIRGVYREAEASEKDEISGIYTASPFYGSISDLLY